MTSLHVRPDIATFCTHSVFCRKCEHWVAYTAERDDAPSRIRCLGDFGMHVIGVVEGVRQVVPYLDPAGGHMLEWD